MKIDFDATVIFFGAMFACFGWRFGDWLIHFIGGMFWH